MITPQTEYPELAQALNIERIYLKREDLHPYGSHKGRSIPVMIDMKAATGVTHFAISSSGNAALAAVRHIQKKNLVGANLSLTIFIGKNINPEKKRVLMAEITDARIIVTESPRPLQSLFNLIKGIGGVSHAVASLRQSTDSDALIGYQTLANEIAQVADLSAVFIPTSSGTAAQAIAESFINNKVKAAVHIVQTTDTSPIAEAFDKEKENNDEKSLADAIVDKVAHRKDALVKDIQKTKGSGWIANNEDIRLAQKLIKEKIGIDLTTNGALGIAGLLKAMQKGEKFTGSIVCVVTGK